MLSTEIIKLLKKSLKILSQFHPYFTALSFAGPVHDVDLVSDVDVPGDDGVGAALEVNVLLVVVIIVAIDVVDHIRHRVDHGQGHAGKHQGNLKKI